MNQLLIAGFMISALASGSAVYAKPAHAARHAAKSGRIESRAEKTRRQIAADLHTRGSNIPPAFSATGKWSR